MGFGDLSNSGLVPPCSGSFLTAEALHEPVGRSYVTVTLVARDDEEVKHFLCSNVGRGWI